MMNPDSTEELKQAIEIIKEFLSFNQKMANDGWLVDQFYPKNKIQEAKDFVNRRDYEN